MVTPPVPSPRYSQERVSSIHPEDLMQIVSHMDSRDKHRVRAAGALEGCSQLMHVGLVSSACSRGGGWPCRVMYAGGGGGSVPRGLQADPCRAWGDPLGARPAAPLPSPPCFHSLLSWLLGSGGGGRAAPTGRVLGLPLTCHVPTVPRGHDQDLQPGGL